MKHDYMKYFSRMMRRVLSVFLSAVLLGGLFSLLPAAPAKAFDFEFSMIQLAKDYPKKGRTPWIMEIGLDDAPDSGTTLSTYVQLYYTYTDKKGQHTKKADAQVMQTGITCFYSSHGPNVQDGYTFPKGNYASSDAQFASMIKAGETYYMMFMVPNDVTDLSEVHISLDPPKDGRYDNIRINYFRIYKHPAYIGDLTQDVGGEYYREFNLFSETPTYVWTNQNADSLKPLAGNSNPGEVVIPLARDSARNTLSSEGTDYVLRVATQEAGGFPHNVRFYVYGQYPLASGGGNHEELVGVVDLQGAAQAQGKSAWAHDLYGNSVIDIPFTGKKISRSTYDMGITRIAVEPLGPSGTGWLPESIALMSYENGDWNHGSYPVVPLQNSPAYSGSCSSMTVSTANNYTENHPWLLLAHWQNSANVAFSSQTRTSVSMDENARPGYHLISPGKEIKSTVKSNLTPTATDFYLMFQTQDKPDAGLKLSTDSFHYTSSPSKDSLKDVYVDVTYQTKTDTQYTSSNTNLQDLGPLYPSVRTMRFYLAEGTWSWLNEKGITDSHISEELFGKGQVDCLPICLLDMATGTADDIIRVELGSVGIDASWQLQSFAIYASEPQITNRDQLKRLYDFGQSMMPFRFHSFHPDVAFKEYPKLYYAPGGGFQLLPGDTLRLNVGERQHLIKPDPDNLAGHLNDGSSNYHPYEPSLNYSSTYLFEIKPSSVAGTSTAKDMEITLNYVDTQGMRQSATYMLNAKTREFYGEPNSILRGTFIPQNQGKDINFLIELKNVQAFQSVTVTLQEFTEAGDKFQLDSVNIYRVLDVDHEVYSNYSVPSIIVFK